MSVKNLNPAGAVPPYKNLFSSVSVVPAGTSLAYISTQWAGDADSNVLHPGDYKAQAKVIWENVDKILKELGCTWKNVAHRKNTFLEFDEEIGKAAVEGMFEALPNEKPEDLLASSLSFQLTKGFHKEGIVLELDLVVAMPS